MSQIYTMGPVVLLLLFVVVAILSAAVKILREYERAVVFTLGRFQAVKGPGLVLLISGIPSFRETPIKTMTYEKAVVDINH
jgi:regulator of protease activity HflC (stomatin/prohibitin superfamily)